MSKSVIACDVGGTQIRIALADDSLRLSKFHHEPIRHLSFSEMIERTKQLITEYHGRHHSDSVGLSMAGHVDAESGTVSYRKVEDNDPPANSWTYDSYNIVAELKAALSTPVSIENDGNASAIAEWKQGAARGFQNVVSLTLGTNLGSGVICKDNIIHRRTSGPLLSSIIVPFDDRYEYVGRLTSGIGLFRMSEQYFGRKLASKEIFELAETGDKTAKAMLADAGKHLGVLVTDCINIFDPEVVVLNGPVMHAADYLLPEVYKIVSEYRIGGLFGPPIIVLGKFIENAGIIGAASIALDALN